MVLVAYVVQHAFIVPSFDAAGIAKATDAVCSHFKAFCMVGGTLAMLLYRPCLYCEGTVLSERLCFQQSITGSLTICEWSAPNAESVTNSMNE